MIIYIYDSLELWQGPKSPALHSLAAFIPLLFYYFYMFLHLLLEGPFPLGYSRRDLPL
jgi:hypothetical protein